MANKYSNAIGNAQTTSRGEHFEIGEYDCVVADAKLHKSQVDNTTYFILECLVEKAQYKYWPFAPPDMEAFNRSSPAEQAAARAAHEAKFAALKESVPLMVGRKLSPFPQNMDEKMGPVAVLQAYAAMIGLDFRDSRQNVLINTQLGPLLMEQHAHWLPGQNTWDLVEAFFGDLSMPPGVPAKQVVLIDIVNGVVKVRQGASKAITDARIHISCEPYVNKKKQVITVCKFSPEAGTGIMPGANPAPAGPYATTAPQATA
jgi:hypothetical protein